jgi:hypothetical protein
MFRKLFATLLLTGVLLIPAGTPETKDSQQSAAPAQSVNFQASKPLTVATRNLSLLSAVGRIPSAADEKNLALQTSQQNRTEALANFAALPLAFEENRGQTDSRVKFLSRAPGYSVFLTQNNAVLSLHSRAPNAPPSASTSIWMTLANANPAATISGTKLLPGHTNYLIGNNPANWHTGLPNFASVQYRNIYPGIDLLYYGKRQALEYDFVVAPGASPNQIEWNVAGASRLSVSASGDLSLSTPNGQIFFKKPVVYQQSAKGRQEVTCAYILPDSHSVKFSLGKYDPSLPLVIDPTLVYSTFLGGTGTGGDLAKAIAVDNTGNAYIAGQASSPNFPTTAGSLQPNYPGFGGLQPFISKIAADGSALIYSTYLGGTDGQEDLALGVAVDSATSAWVTGIVSATDFPTVNPFQTALGAGVTGSAFVSKLSTDGSTLLFSSYLGGKNSGDLTQGSAIAIDIKDRSAYVAGFTTSTIFPTVAPLQVALAGTQNAFVTKFTTAGAIVYSTYLGGSAIDQANAIVADTTGTAYVTGSTSSLDFPTLKPFQAENLGGVSNAFISELKADGSALLYSTYLGGGNGAGFVQGDRGFAIDLVGGGLVVVAGQTDSLDFPTATPVQGQYAGGSTDGFITEIRTDGTAPVFSTFVGGSGDDIIKAISLDSLFNVYFAGQTTSPDLAVVSPLQGLFAGTTDVLAGSLKADGSAYDFLTYIGVTGNNIANGIKVLGPGAGPANTYITGSTDSSAFPTVNALQPALGLGFDSEGLQTTNAFITKISSAASTTVTAFPASGNFGLQNVGTISAALPITITNDSTLPLSPLSFTFTGANAVDFATSANGTNCSVGKPVAPGSSCIEELTFTPGAEDLRTATFTFGYNSGGANSNVTVPLTGQGTNPAVTLDQTSLAFGSTPFGSPNSLFVGVTNSGGGPLTVGNVRVSGPNAASFTVQNFCTFTVLPQQGCGLLVQFSPTAVGAQSATLEINDNAPGSPQTVSITGTGVSQVTLNPTSIDFGTQALNVISGFPHDATLLNGAATPLTIASVIISGPNASDFSLAANSSRGPICQGGAIVSAIGGTCDIPVNFTPSAVGTRTATITITDNGTGGPRTISLTGVGAIGVVVTPNPVDVGAVVIQTTGDTFAVITNYTGAALTVQSLVISAANQNDFTAASAFGAGACQAAANGGACFLQVNFTPSIIGPESATLTISYAGTTGSPITVPLTATGVNATVGGVGFTSSNVQFGGQLVTQTSNPAMALGLFNTSGSTKGISGINLSGANAGDFAILSSPSNCAAGGTLGPKSQCQISITFKPTANGARTATISATIVGATAGGPTATLSGIGAPATIVLSDTTLDFGMVLPNPTVPVDQSVFLLNGSPASITLSATAATITGTNAGDFSIDAGTTCLNNAAVIGNGGNCQLVVGFKPAAVGPRTATATIFDSDSGSPRSVTLVGVGTSTTPFATVNPSTLTFASQTLNTTAAAQTVTVTNRGGSPLLISSGTPLTLGGTNAGDFAIATGTTCTPNLSIAANASCVINITFTPTVAGARTATLTINDNSGGPPTQQTVTLSGTGAASGGGGITFQPPSLTFASTPLAHVIVQETGGANPNTLGFTGAFGGTAPGSASGGTWNIAAGPWNTNYDIYELTTANQTDLAAADGYTYTATYNNLSTNTSPTFPGAPFSYGSYANLSVKNIRFDLGMHSDGQGNQVLALDPFDANSPVFTIPGLGTNPVTLTLLYNNTTQRGDAYVNGVKVISGYAGNSTAFTGENVVFGGEQANFSNVELIAGLPAAVATASLTLTNSATAPLNFTAPAAITGPNAGDFTFAPGSTCAVGTAVPANGSCVLNLVFLPTAVGTRTATLTFSDDATPGTQTVTLNGTGAAPNAPAVTLNPSSVGFPATSLDTTAAPIAVTLTNSGNAPLNVGSFGIDEGQNSGDFAISTRSTCGPQSTIAAGNSCTIILMFTPSALGERTATLSISDDAAPGTQSLPLSGTGVGAGNFTITAPGATIVLNNGQTAKFPITISPAPGSTIQVTFFAPGPVPTGTCVFYPQPNPATVTSAQTFNFLFTTNAPQPGLVAPQGNRPESPFRPLTIRTLLAQMVIAFALLLLLWWQKFRARGFSLPRYAVLASMLIIAALTFVGCGGGGSNSTNGGNVSTPAPRGITVPGTYQIVISASSGTATHSTTVTVQIN